MEREEGEDMFYFLFSFTFSFGLVGECRREYIFFSNLCPGREQKKSRVCLSVCLSVL